MRADAWPSSNAVLGFKKRLTPPDAVRQDIRRVQTRIFTGFKAGK